MANGNDKKLKPKGTPKPGVSQKGQDANGGTKLVRVNADIADMLKWVTRVKGRKSAQYLDPLVRATLIKDYKENEKAIDILRQAEANSQEEDADDE